MCNAWHHHRECTCGWGGDGHKGKSPGGNFVQPSISNFLHLYQTFINPNASCPVCGAPVFFYQSPYGGRVFFDELGPPWPKHPCTDRSKYDVTFRPHQRQMSIANQGDANISLTRKHQWLYDGWKPFRCTKISQAKNTFICGHFVHERRNKISTSSESQELDRVIFYLRGKYHWKATRPFFIRKTSESSVWCEIATFLLNEETLNTTSINVQVCVVAQYRDRVNAEFTRKA